MSTASALLVVFCVLLGGAGCRRAKEPQPAADAAPPSPTAAASHSSQPPPLGSNASPVAESDLPAVLAQLTQAARRYGVEQQRAPKSFEELITAGYLSAVPAAPPGKRFVIDKNLQVVVAPQ